MGLASGAHGAKAVLRAACEAAFLDVRSTSYSTLCFEAAHRFLGGEPLTPDATTIAIDGNILLHQFATTGVNVHADTLSLNLFLHLKGALANARVVIVVFDDPATITRAKRDEQARRDDSLPNAAAGVPSTDAFTTADLDRLVTCEPLVRNRATRSRLIDEVVRRIRGHARDHLAGSSKALLFDGVDPRGADRPFDAARDPVVMCDDDRMGDHYASVTTLPRSAEGDLKLAYAQEAVRTLAGIRLHLSVTVDTDSLAIELLEHARRLEQNERTPCVLLCMRNRAAPRAAASFTCFCPHDAFAELQHLFWIAPRLDLKREQLPDLSLQRDALGLFVAGLALCGCDFVKLKGMRADHVLQNVSKLCGQTSLAAVRNVHSKVRDDTVREALAPLVRSLVKACHNSMKSTPRVQKATIEALRAVDESTIRRACWTLCYWSHREIEHDLASFGFDDAPPPPTTPPACAGP